MGERMAFWRALRIVSFAVLAIAVAALFIPADWILQGRLSPESQRYEAILTGIALFRLALLLLGLYLVGLALWGKRLWGAQTDDTLPLEGAFTVSREDLAILPILGLALALRIYRLNMGFWYDEVMTITEVVRRGVYWIMASPPSAHNPLLHSALTWVTFALLGESEITARLFPLLFGVAGIGAFYITAKPLLGWRAALMGALLMTVSPFHIYYSQEGRGYSGLMFFSLVWSLLFVYLVFLGYGRRGALWVGYSVSGLLALLMHPYAVFILAVHILLSLYLWAGRGLGVTGGVSSKAPAARRGLICCGGIGLFTLLAYSIQLPQMLRFYALHGREVGLGASSGWRFLARMWVEFSAGGGYLTGGAVGGLLTLVRVFILSGGWNLVAGTVYGLLALVGGVILWRREREILIVVLSPFVLALALVAALGTFVNVRYFSFAFPIWLLLVACGFVATWEWVGGWLRRRKGGTLWAGALGGLLVLSLCALSLPTLARYYSLGKCRMKDAAQRVKAEPSSSGVVLGAGLHWLQQPVFEYYFPEGRIVDEAKALDQAFSAGEDVWLVTGYQGGDNLSDLHRLVVARANLVQEYVDFEGHTFTLWRKLGG